MRKQAIIAFVVAPLASCAILSLVVSAVTPRGIHPQLGAGLVNGFLFLLPFAYIAALLAGVPAHVMLGRAGLFELWHYTLAGLAIGLLPGCLVLTTAPLGVAASFWLVGVLAGPVAGMFFWAIAVRRDPTRGHV